jgi:hypothetical protein
MCPVTAMSVTSSSRPSFDVQYHEHQHGPKNPRRPRGRWIWTISGLVVIGAMTAFVGLLSGRPNAIRALPMGVRTRTLTLSQLVTRLSLRSYGGDVRVIGGGSGTHVTEQVYYDPQQGPVPMVAATGSDGQLSLAAPACQERNCLATFTVTVPSTASVTAVTDGGNVVVSHIAAATLDSGGGAVSATAVSGPLTISSEGGNQDLSDINGPVNDLSGGGAVVAAGVTGSSAVIVTEGGQLSVQRLSVQSATISSGGGGARVEFATAPTNVDIASEGGIATVLVPGGPYALTADSGGSPRVVGIPTSPAATSILTVTTGGNALVIQPSSSGAAGTGPVASSPANQHVVPVPPLAPQAPGS